MSPIMNSSEKRPDAPPSWRQDDLESFEAEPRQDVKSSRRLKLTIIAGLIVFFVFLFDGKTPRMTSSPSCVSMRADIKQST
jgi:hypothetical protein